MAKYLVSLIGTDYGGNIFGVEVSCSSINAENACNTALSLLDSEALQEIEVNWVCECFSEAVQPE